MLFIAEIGLNHNGNHNLCYELIKQAKAAGADIAKFQLGWKSGEGEINHLDLPMLQKLNRWCRYFEIEFLVSVFTQQAFELAKEIPFKRYKIASRTVKGDLELVKSIVAEGKPTLISLGMWEAGSVPIENANNIKYLWCKSAYPASPWELKDMPKDFTSSPYDGYSDHSVGIEIPLMAISRGAEIIEKHFTLDKSDVTIRDHALSATPDEFAILTSLGRNIAKNLQIGV